MTEPLSRPQSIQDPDYRSAYRGFVRVVPLAYLVLAPLLVEASLVCGDCALQTPAPERPHQVLNSIKIGGAWDRDRPARAIPVSYKLSSHRSNGRVELLALVTLERDEVAGDRPNDERHGAHDQRIDTVDELKELLQLLAPPMFWLFAGLLVGGAWTSRRRAIGETNAVN